MPIPEFTQLVVTLLIVILGAWLTYHYGVRQRNYETLIAAKLAHYERIAPLLNTIFRYRQCIGDYLDLSPEDILTAKRKADEEFFVYSFIWGSAFRRAYTAFMASSFVLYVRPRAIIRAQCTSYIIQPTLTGWKGFSGEGVNRIENLHVYQNLMDAIAEDLPFVRALHRQRRKGPTATYERQRPIMDELVRQQKAEEQARKERDATAKNAKEHAASLPSDAPHAHESEYS